jgi:CheY-like chemotaxis protein
VLDISRIESDQLRLSVQAVDMVALLRESVGMLQPAADIRGCRFEGPALAQAWCLADPHRLRQCLLNLLSNAVKYGPAGGQIDLGVELGSLGLTLRVRDRGPGFSADQLKHLFEPFNRLGAERSTTEGTGLGLLITRKLVESMGGALAVGNADEGGACMSLRLPAAPVPDVLTGAMAQAGARAGRALAGGARTARQVLYVEDNEVNAILMGAVFRLRPHWALHVVSTAAQALEWVARQRPDLFLLDLNLPDLDGFTLRDCLCAMPGCAEVPMVAVSADALAVHAGRELPQAFDAWWTKPIDVDDVLEQLDAMLDRPTQAPP